MTISPDYGLFISLANPKLFGFVAGQIAPQDYLPVPKSLQLEEIATKNSDKLLMVPIHHEKNPYYIGEPDGEGTLKRVKIWVTPSEPMNSEKMVLIQENEYNIGGETVIVPDRMMVGAKAPVYAMMKMTCCSDDHCSQAPYSAVPCFPQQGQLYGELIDPVAGVLENRPQILADGIRILRPQDLHMVQDLATHVWAHGSGKSLPDHDCHHADQLSDVNLGGSNIMKRDI